MNGVFCTVVVDGWDSAVILKIGGYCVLKFGCQGFLHGTTLVVSAGTRCLHDQIMRRMRRTEAFSQKLRTEHAEVFGDRHNFCLRMEMVDRCCQVASSDKSQGSILDELQFGYIRRLGVRKPNWGSKVETGLNQSAVSNP